MAFKQPVKPDLRTVIGVGIDFPVTFSDETKDKLLDTQGGVTKIKQSIFLILFTRIGERYNNPEFGSNIRDLLFEMNDAITKDLLYMGITTALRRWERRITVTSVQLRSIADDPNAPEFQGPYGDQIIYITINFVINETHQVGSFVFPFVRGPMPMSQIIQGKEFFRSSGILAR